MSNTKVQIIELKNDYDYQPLLGDEPKTCGMRSGRVYLKPGEECGQHSTGNHEEMLIFLSGKGNALIGEKEASFEIGDGKVCYIPPRTPHNIRNTSVKPLVYIYCVAPVMSDHNHSEQHEHRH